MAQGNPNHPVTQQMQTEWHKICAIMMLAVDRTEFEITPELVNDFVASGKMIACDLRGGRMVIRLMTEAEGERLARQEGGLPS